MVTSGAGNSVLVNPNHLAKTQRTYLFEAPVHVLYFFSGELGAPAQFIKIVVTCRRIVPSVSLVTLHGLPSFRALARSRIPSRGRTAGSETFLQRERNKFLLPTPRVAHRMIVKRPF
ncbi:hypothetical protein CDAR_306901 [Caerostris darwini]|uniref:Uncharacterized protein n=1 Tax=Caerostris darwini TaxID=1538125 RepID=A0AAV4QTV7_9ARAC|nr:hypothetical protein CDAR_306901 [Caerostris darwini]